MSIRSPLIWIYIVCLKLFCNSGRLKGFVMNGMEPHQLAQTMQLDLCLCRLVHGCLISVGYFRHWGGFLSFYAGAQTTSNLFRVRVHIRSWIITRVAIVCILEGGYFLLY